MENFRRLSQRWWPDDFSRYIFALLLIAMAFWKLWVAIYTPNQLEMIVAADHLSKMQVKYRPGLESTGERTATYELQAGGLRKVHLSLRAARFSSLRLYPGQGPNEIRLASMRIRTGVPGWLGHRTLHRFDLADLTPVQHVDELVPEGKTVRIEIGDENDSCLSISSPETLTLGIDWLAPGCQFLLSALYLTILWMAGAEICRLNTFQRVRARCQDALIGAISSLSLQKCTELFCGTILPLACVTLVLFFREPGFFTRPQLWAEDAKVLFYEARVYGWHSLWMPHPAYYILAQRLVACAAADVSALFVPWIYCYAALAYTLLSAWFCLRARLDSLVDTPGRIAMALALVLIPQGGETQMRLIGCQWVLMSILLILIVQDQSRTRGQAVVDVAGLFLAGLTGPYIILFAPWFLVRLRREAGGWSRYNLGLVVIAWSLALVQTVRILTTSAAAITWSRNPDAWINELMIVLPGDLFFGEKAPIYLGRAMYVLAPIALLLLGYAVVCGDRKRRCAGLVLCGCGVFAYVAGLRAVAPNLDVTPFAAGDRYFTPIYTVALWLGILYYHDASRRLRIASAIALGMMLMSSASHFMGEEWPDLGWEEHVRSLDAGEAVNFTALPGWDIQIPKRK